MDDPGLDPGEHRLALTGLARINRISMADRPIAALLRGVHARLGRTVRVVDVATGSGDVIIAAARRSRAEVELILTDISPVALEMASSRAREAGVPIQARCLDILSHSLPEADVVVCTLFLHHLGSEDAVLALDRMRESADWSVMISDLRRCASGTGLARVVPRVLTRSGVVHVDAVRSARAAWTMGEMRGILARANMETARVRRAYPARMLAEWSRRGEVV